jgi:hypothetical protein
MREFCMSGSARGAVRLSTLGRPYRNLPDGGRPGIRQLVKSGLIRFRSHTKTCDAQTMRRLPVLVVAIGVASALVYACGQPDLTTNPPAPPRPTSDGSTGTARAKTIGVAGGQLETAAFGSAFRQKPSLKIGSLPCASNVMVPTS